MARLNKDIKLQMYISEKMDDSIVHLSELMGVTKSEFVRMCIAQTVLGYEKSVELTRQMMVEANEKKSPSV